MQRRYVPFSVVALSFVVSACGSSASSEDAGTGRDGAASTSGHAGASGGSSAGGASGGATGGGSATGGTAGSPAGAAGKPVGGAGGKPVGGAGGNASGGAGGKASGGGGGAVAAGAGGSATAGGSGGAPPPPAGPGELTVSSDGRRLLRDGKPFFWLADTEYLIFHEASHADVQKALDTRQTQGFNVIKVYDNVNGNYTTRMWTGSALNEGYIHDHVDFVVDEIERRGMFLVVVLHESSPIELARALLARYANRRAVLFWVLRNGMDDYVSAITSIVGARALPATYIYEIDQSGDWRQLYTAVGGGDAARLFDLRPARPIVMADGMYDQDLPGPTCDGCSDDFGSAFHRTPFGIRRGAWVTFTHGGFFTYGHPPVWGYPSGWESELTFPSVAFLTRFQRFWTAIAWEKLTPDRALASEIAGDDFVKEHLGVLRSTAGDGVYAYFPGPGSARVALDSLTATNVVASWFNPATGDAPAAGNFKRTDKPVFSVPGGWEDALLVVKPAP